MNQTFSLASLTLSILFSLTLVGCGVPMCGAKVDGQNSCRVSPKRSPEVLSVDATPDEYATMYCDKALSCSDRYLTKEDCLESRKTFYQKVIVERAKPAVCGDVFVNAHLTCLSTATCEELKCNQSRDPLQCVRIDPSDNYYASEKVENCQKEYFEQNCHPSSSKEAPQYSKFVEPIAEFCGTVETSCPQSSALREVCSYSNKQWFPFLFEAYSSNPNACTPETLKEMSTCIQAAQCNPTKLAADCFISDTKAPSVDANEWEKRRNCTVKLH